MLFVKYEIVEGLDPTMARFMMGINPNIQDVVVMDRFRTLKELIHQATKVEIQFKRKSFYKRSSSSYTWKIKGGGEGILR